ncbi:Flagellar biosynthesis pathway, component FlhB [Butyrivibrio fibrisolvens 16/4]|nr:Flagellar biosynthesis pathway, component FlhB [Butyrivibrio fibrisolvens 16/4]
MEETRVLLIPYNLQFFADGEGGEKTEQPTSKKLSDARKEGKVAKSKEIVNGIALLGFFFALRVFLSFAGVRFEEIFAWVYAIIPDVISMNGSGLTIQTLHGIISTLLLKTLIILLPFLWLVFYRLCYKSDSGGMEAYNEAVATKA